MNDIITEIIIKLKQKIVYWILFHIVFTNAQNGIQTTKKAPFISHHISYQQTMLYAESEFLVQSDFS